MRVIPVIDLQAGQAVHARGGEREKYQRLRSDLIPTAEPADVARGLCERYHSRELYVADLDALQGRPGNWTAWQQIGAAVPLPVWCDAGWPPRYDAAPATFRWIASLESMPTPQAAADAAAAKFGGNSSAAAFSIDLREGRPIASSDWPDDPVCIGELAAECGFCRMILLDLARVGMGEGPRIEALCAALRRRLPHVELIAGGGVRDRRDLQALRAAGADAVLVASALHNGRLSPADVRSFQLE